MLFLIIPFTWNLNFKEIFASYKKAFNTKKIAIWFISFQIIFLPQLIYWKYAFGSYFSYSYPQNEGFSNFLSPKILEVLFFSTKWFASI
jgi:hypothetical protein